MKTLRTRPVIILIVLFTLLAACSQPTPATTLPPAATEPATSPPEATEPATAVATTEGTVVEVSPLLFSDDFQDGDASTWTITAGWAVRNTDVRYYFSSAQLGGAYVPTGRDWTDYRYRSAFRVNEGHLLVSIQLSQDGRYVLRLGGDGVVLLKEQPAGEYTTLASAGAISTNTWHGLSFASLDGHLQVHIDQVVWFDVTDPAPLAGGTIAVGTVDGTQAAVDNVTVTQITTDLPALTPQAPAPIQATAVDEDEMEKMSASLPAEEVQTVPGAAAEPAPEAATQPAPVATTQPAPEATTQPAPEATTQPAPEAPTQTAPPPVAAGQPDLVVWGADFIPEPQQGVSFIANFTATNSGNAAAGPFTLLLHFHALAGIPDCAVSFAGLAPGEAAMGQCVAVSNGNAGYYPVEVTADSGGAVAESNEGNNMLVTGFTLGGAAVVVPPTDVPVVTQPDLAATNIYYFEDINNIPYYKCDVVNNGNAGSGSTIAVQALVNGVPLFNNTIQILDPGGSYSFGFPVTNDKPFTITCIVDASGAIAESDEGNNSMTVEFP